MSVTFRSSKWVLVDKRTPCLGEGDMGAEGDAR